MIFDGQNKRIIMEENEDILELKQMYHSWKQWLTKDNNIKYPLAVRYVGGDEVQNKTLGLTFILMNNWKIKPYEANHVLHVIGNLYTDDQSMPFIKTNGDYNVIIQSEVSNIIDIVSTKVYNNNAKTNSPNQDNQDIQDNNDGDDWALSS